MSESRSMTPPAKDPNQPHNCLSDNLPSSGPLYHLVGCSTALSLTDSSRRCLLH